MARLKITLKEAAVFAVSIHILIAALILAIGIQNTCPHGWAGKTAFISSHVSHCGHMKDNQRADTDSREDSRKGSCHVNQTFVFHLSKPETAAQNTASVQTAIAFVADPIPEVFSDSLLKPPTDHLFV